MPSTDRDQAAATVEPVLDLDPSLDICGLSSCPGAELDPEFPALVCTLPVGHGEMHRQAGVSCAWGRDDA